MEITLFDLTPAQQALLTALARETGKPIPVLLTEALEGLQERVRPGCIHGDVHDSSREHDSTAPSIEVRRPLWEQCIEAFKDVPEEEREHVPVDGAAQHDHYIYGIPKRPA